MRKPYFCTVILMLFCIAGCASQYKLPEGGQPYALVKVKVVYDQRKARNIPPLTSTLKNDRLAVTIKDGDRTFNVLSKILPVTTDPGGVLSEITAFKIHPARPVTLSVYTGIHWQTRQMERVKKTERVPKQVTKTVSEYDSRTRRTRYVTKTVTEYETKTRWVNEYVTKDHSRGCTASAKFTPVKDEVYLIDYGNRPVVDGCALQVYRQVPLKDGKFKLEAVDHPEDTGKK